MKSIRLLALITSLAATPDVVVSVVAADDQRPQDTDAILRSWSFSGVGSRWTMGSSQAGIQTAQHDVDAPFSKVWAFYAKGIGIDRGYDENKGYVEGGTRDGARFFLRDVMATDKAKRKQTYFVSTTEDHTVSVIIKPAGEKTHVEIILVLHH